MELNKITSLCIALLFAGSVQAQTCFTKGYSFGVPQKVRSFGYSAPIRRSYSAPVRIHKAPIRRGTTYYSGIYNTEIDTKRLASEVLLLQQAAEDSLQEMREETLEFLEMLASRQSPQEIRARAEGIARIIEAATRTYCEEEEQEDPEQPALPLTTQACGKCHLGADIKGGFDLARLDGNSTIAALLQVSSGAMPPESALPPNQKVAIINELLRYGIAKQTPSN